MREVEPSTVPVSVMTGHTDLLSGVCRRLEIRVAGIVGMRARRTMTGLALNIAKPADRHGRLRPAWLASARDMAAEAVVVQMPSVAEQRLKRA